MKIKELSNDGLTSKVELIIGKEDYTEKKKKALNKFRKEAELKGFRKGMAPISLIEKIHGRNALADTINELIQEGINQHITDKKLSIIGEPLPIETEDKNDWMNPETFTFQFELGFAPKVEIKITKEDKLIRYKPTVTAKIKNEYKANLEKQYGTLEKCDDVKEDGFMLSTFVQGETSIKESYVAMKGIAVDKKAEFIGKKAGDTLKINVNEMFPNETDRAAMLKMKKEELAAMDPNWIMTITECKTYVDAKMGKTFYNQVFGEDQVHNAQEFETKLVERIEKELEQEVDYRFTLDTRDYLLKKTDIQISRDFMKRWLITVNEGKFTEEQVEKDMDLFLKDFRWQTISQYIMKEQKLQVTNEAVMEQAKLFAKYQFNMYGLQDVPEEQLTNFANTIIKNEKESRRIFEKVEQDLVINYVKSVATITEEKITSDKLQKMNQEENKQ
ncbi:MAG: trigger factor [Bacteroidales bacterium]